jgi:hypothetical protein
MINYIIRSVIFALILTIYTITAYPIVVQFAPHFVIFSILVVVGYLFIYSSDPNFIIKFIANITKHMIKGVAK